MAARRICAPIVQDTALLLLLLLLLIPDGLKKYATLCKEAGMAVSPPPGQSCHVIEWH